ncbi:MAG: alpha/beta hydrolase [Archaeoglobaceae archaeon]|nr:alpha/beta hydrolase [Archaeoglobaceae archaeon]MDW8118149.1 alpha/beta hydrolase [Archaeoglobaceae archaeon]
MPFVENDGLKIYYEFVEGESPAMVFIHGWTANMNFWKEQRTYFQGKNAMLFIDNRGHGKSEKPKEYKYYHFEKFVSDLEAVVNSLKLNDFVLVGHSFGTMISMKFCYEHADKVKALILIGGGTRIKAFHKFFYPISKLFSAINYRSSVKLVENLSFAKNAVELKEWALKQVLDNTPRYSAMNGYKTLTKIDLREVAKKIEKPTLIIVGEKDALLPLEKSKELNRLIKNSKLVVVPEVGHCVQLEKPEIVNREIEGFYAKLR